MIINEIRGDVTSPQFGIIGHGVNCQGVMGSGVALTIRNKFPKAYEAYLELCNNTSDRTNLLGTTQLVEITPDLYVANMFTQFTFGRDGGPYASIQAVRGACAHLEILRDKLIAQKYDDVIFDLLCELHTMTSVNHEHHIDLSDGSSRVRDLNSLAEQMLATVHGAHKSDAKDAQYVLPIYLPLIGCGLGGLQWETTRPSIDSHTGHAPVTIYHYQN